MNFVSNRLGHLLPQFLQRRLSQAKDNLTHFKFRGLSGWTWLGLITGIPILFG